MRPTPLRSEADLRRSVAGRLNSFETTPLWVECGIPAAAAPLLSVALHAFGFRPCSVSVAPCARPSGGKRGGLARGGVARVA
jgi:hypothetical protein